MSALMSPAQSGILGVYMDRMKKSFQFIQADEGLNDPNSSLVDAGSTVPAMDQPGTPPEADGNGLGQIILIAGLLLAVVAAFLVFKSLRDGGVRRLQSYEEATRTGLIGGGATLLIIAGFSWYISRQGF